MARSGNKRARKVAMSIAAVGVATSVAGVAATQPASISASLVDLTALIVVGSSTNPTGTGVENFFGGKFNDPIYTGTEGDDIVYVNFSTGPLGIKQALEANAGEQNAVIASGWGAANLSLLMLLDDPDLSQTVVVLDNNVAGPDGGFGTRYPWFALIGVNPFPTPSDTGALAAVQTQYEYDYNSGAPADVLNPFAAVNSLAAYLNTRLNQAELDLPVNADGTPDQCNANTCAITTSGAVLDCQDARCSSPEDRITAYVTTRDDTTYVTYTSDGLPLANLIRRFVPFGDRIADLTEPLLKLLVDSAYYEGNPIPRDPSAYRPVRLFPSPAELLATIAKIPGAIREGLAAATSQEPSTNATTVDTAELSATEARAVSDDATTAQSNVAQDSDKPEPGPVDVDGIAAEDPESVDTEDGSQTETTTPTQDDADPATNPDADDASEPDATEPDANEPDAPDASDIDADNNAGDDTDNDANNDANADDASGSDSGDAGAGAGDQ